MNKIWKYRCKNCHSAHHKPDPEALDMERWFKAGEIEIEVAIFPCAWRPNKLCKGVCDKMGVGEKEVENYKFLNLDKFKIIGPFKRS